MPDGIDPGSRVMNIFDRNNQSRFTRIAEQRAKKLPLDGEDALIAEIMNQHPEFDKIWPLGEMSSQPQEVNGNIVNPFVHATLHTIIEKQIEMENPPEVGETLKALLDQHLDRHEAIHRIVSVYADLYFRNFRKGVAFEEEIYLEQLKGLRGEPT